MMERFGGAASVTPGAPRHREQPHQKEQSVSEPHVPVTDQDGAQVLANHHTDLGMALHAMANAVITAAAQGDGLRTAQTRDDLLEWCAGELLPYVAALRSAVLPRVAAQTRGELLARALEDQAELLLRTAGALREAPTAVHAAIQAHALQTLYDTFLNQLDELMLPLLVDADTPMVHVIAELHAAIAARPSVAPTAGGGCGGGCGCGSGGGCGSNGGGCGGGGCGGHDHGEA